jgi:PAS domain S-box-containing protein
MQHPAERSEKKQFLSDLFNRPESVPLLLFILFFAILYGAGTDLRSSKFIFDPPWLLIVLNTVFVMGLCLLIAGLCFRSFLRGGFLNVLLLGCGVLAFGLTSFAAAWLIRPPYGLNEAVTIRNIGVLCTAAFFFLSSLFTAFGISMEIEHRRGLIAVMAYTGVFTMGAILTAATLLHFIPPFFIAGEGPTIIRQVVLAVSVTLFTLSAILMMMVYSERKTGFLLYSINALLLFGAGIVGVSLGVPGSPLSWLGRAAQYMGNVYLVVASMQALAEARRRGTSVEKALAGFFRKSETHYKALVEMAADAIVSIDREGKILLMNPVAEETFGYSRDEAFGQSLAELMVPEQSRDSFHACLSGESRRDMEMELARKDGLIFPAELSFSQEMKSDGSSERTIIIRDVTERRLAEEAIQSAALFPIQNPEPILRIHRDGTLLFSNPAAEPVLKEWRAASKTGIPAQVRQAVEAALNEGIARDIEVQIAGRDFSFVVTPIVKNHYANLYGGDVTESKRAEEALQRSEERYRGLFESMNEGFALHELLYDESGEPCDYRFLDVNPAFERLTGVKRGEVIGKTVLEAMPGTEPLWIKRYGEVALTGTPAHFESHSSVLDRDYEVFAYRPEPGYFAVIFMDITERKQAEEALRNSEARLRLAHDAGKAGTWEWDLRTHENIWSEELWKLYGLDPHDCEPTYETWRQTIHPDDRAKAEQIVQDAATHGAELNAEWRVRDRDGSIRWLMSRGQPQIDVEGRPMRYIGIVVDITARKRAEQALRGSDARYRSYTEVTGQLGWTTNADGEIVDNVPAFQQYTGQTFDEVRGWGWSKALHPDDLEITLAVWRKAVEDKQGYEIEYRLRRHDGVYRYFLARGVPILQDDGSVREWVGTCIDITERNQAEAALRQNEARFRQLADSMPQLVWTAEPGGRVDYFNHRLSLFTTRGPWRPAVYAEDRPRSVEAWKSAVRTGSPYEIEHRLQLADGRFRWFLTRAVPVPDETGQVMKWYGTSTDVDDRRRVEEEREIARIEATTERIRIEALMEVLPVGVALVDESGGNVQSNIMYDQIWGEPRPEARSVDGYGKYKAWWIDSGRQVQPDEWASARAVKKGESVTGQMMRIERFDGTTAFVMNSAVPIHDVDGKITGSAVVILDITERIEIEQALKQTKDELEDKVRERTAELMLLLEDLEKSRDELRKLASELVLAEERERKKISVTLHDEVAQTLAATRMRIDLLRSKPGDDDSRRAIDEAQQLLVQAIRETRALMTDISNPVLYDMGLRVAVQSLTEEVTAQKGISVSCSFGGRLTSLTQDLEVMIFQLVKELVQNIVKHSGARKASIRIVEERDDINVVVADDGQGFDVGNIGSVGVNGGFGLFSIRERVKSYHGKIKIESEPGKGSEVTVMLPKKAAGVAVSRKTGKRKEKL